MGSPTVAGQAARMELLPALPTGGSADWMRSKELNPSNVKNLHPGVDVPPKTCLHIVRRGWGSDWTQYKVAGQRTSHLLPGQLLCRSRHWRAGSPVSAELSFCVQGLMSHQGKVEEDRQPMQPCSLIQDSHSTVQCSLPFGQNCWQHNNPVSGQEDLGAGMSR